MANADWPSFIDALGWALLHFCWQALLIAAAYAWSRSLLQRPQTRLLAGHGALLALAAMPPLTLAVCWPGTDVVATAALVPDATAAAVATATRAMTVPLPWTRWLVAGWAFGVLALALRSLWQASRLWAIRREAVPLPAPWQQQLDRLVLAFGTRRPQLRESVRVACPLLVGWLKPMILLPAGLSLRLPPQQLELLLAHELAHLRRGDVLANLLQVALETVLFYHPAVHWISRRVRADREQCCDDLVTRIGAEPLDYARALLAVAEQRARWPQLALAAGGGELMLRIERIVGREPVQRRADRRSGWIIALTVLAVLALQRLPEDAPLPIAALPALVGPAWTAQQFVTPDLIRLHERPRIVPHALDADPADGFAAAPALGLPARAPRLRPAGALDWRPPAAPTALERPLAERSVALAGPDATEAGARSTAPAAVVPTQRVAPTYPASALWRGIEGFVVLSFRIDRGHAVDIRIEQQAPAGAFAGAAEQALRQWRFDRSADGAARQQQRFDFTLSESTDRDDCARPTGTRICRPLN